MILEPSAVVAILRQEEGAQAFADAIEADRMRRMSAASFLETALVVDAAKNAPLSAALEEFMRDAKVILEPFTLDQARLARLAYRVYGKGSGHPARLNLGDCFAYALAKTLGEPLLYKGGDFSQTDVASALPPAKLGESSRPAKG